MYLGGPVHLVFGRPCIAEDDGAQPVPVRPARDPPLLPRVAAQETHLHVQGATTAPCTLHHTPCTMYIAPCTLQEEEAKLLYGMLFSMKSFVHKLSPLDMKEGFLSYTTSVYRCLPWPLHPQAPLPGDRLGPQVHPQHRQRDQPGGGPGAHQVRRPRHGRHVANKSFQAKKKII